MLMTTLTMMLMVGGGGGCCRITNSPIADVFVVWGKTQEDGKVRGFILDKVRFCTELASTLPIT